MFTGEITIEVQGAKRNLKFGTLSFGLFCEAEGIELNEMINRLKAPRPFTQLNLIHSAAVASCRINKTDPGFCIEDVSVWIDEVGEEVISDMLTQAIRTYSEKKTAAQKKEKDKAGKVGRKS